MKAKLAAGNWKMNGLSGDLIEIETLIGGLSASECDVLICPPATLIHRMHDMAIGSDLLIGAQDCHPELKGAHTGDLSAAMLADAGATHVILGHSERRADHGETDAIVRAKAVTALERGLTAIVCVGETEAERDAGTTLAVIGTQLCDSLPGSSVAAHVVIAYEPVWAIGTGRTPTLEQIAEVHAFLREQLTDRFADEGNGMRLLYGGSVKPENAQAIFALANVDGALVGGASLKAADFARIVTALSDAK
ncbi:triose-phosphate isomerase [Oceanicola sp. D3]|uniref:triose-phosphate isomerase n=1 Tax=Oceanicola sp. D3 TaxID=2587163 RepID=UPI001121FC5C|nr:triose-phosphate isomerase [Oceanicola sp. D3]QDC09351.1 triose-phosphate isomerase [Oceanicola sp. D3]